MGFGGVVCWFFRVCWVTVADRYASSATQTKPLRDRPTAAARSCALALRAGGHLRGNDVVLIFISI